MRLLVVSNRLPVTVVERNGKLEFQESVGGLVSGLSSYLSSLKGSSFTACDYVWVGWPGITVEKQEREGLDAKALSEFRACPVYISEAEMETFYHGFCNKTIWPLFHYFSDLAVFDEHYWESYERVNEIFCSTLMKILRPGDVVWIHDYHLMLLPKLIKERTPDVPIGFFLHIPFPFYELFRLMRRQWSIDILNGMLGANLLGFHTHDYAQYFLQCVLRILGHEHNMGTIILEDHVTKVSTFPIGIDFSKFYSWGGSPEEASQQSELHTALAGFKSILSVDRLDYTKGVINRLRGYKTFLEENSQWHGKVVLILIVVPSRIGVEDYERMKNQIDEQVGTINGEFGGIGWTPILYQFRFLPAQTLIPLYKVSDIALVTPLRDGMNLVAKEYVAARADQTGVLILSEMAGASKELGEAIIINPNNSDEIASAIKEALQMPKGEQIRRNRIMQDRLRRWDVIRWADRFIEDLLSVTEQQKRFSTRLVTPGVRRTLVQQFEAAGSRLVFLDYDGTLVPFASDPRTAAPDNNVMRILTALCDAPATEVVLVSGRDSGTLESWFGRLPLALVAEHGVSFKEKNGHWGLLKPLTNRWISEVRSILDTYVDRLPGSFVEEKGFSIVWHYRNTDPEPSSILARELTHDLVSFTANMDLQVLPGHKVVEIRNSGVNKGMAGLHWLSKGHFDFVLVIGDDWTDEELFAILPESAYSVRVGMVQSHAKLNVRNQVQVIELLQELIESVRPTPCAPSCGKAL